jgi:hypothetical protein
LISPYTVKARSILQELWKVDIEWDQQIPEEFSKRWQDWLDELFILASTITIPRWLQFKDGRTATIHVFCDASSRVFCCCAYVRITTGVTSRGEKDSEIDNEEVLDVLLITAKARVTPTKTDSIIRLELAGCVLGVRLGNAVASAFEISPDKSIIGRILPTACTGSLCHHLFQKPLSQIEWERSRMNQNRKSGDTFHLIKTRPMYKLGFRRLMISRKANYGGMVQISYQKAKSIGQKSLF